MGWYIAEGYCKENSCLIAQTRQEDRKKGTSKYPQLIDLMNKLGITYTAFHNCVSISGGVLNKVLEELCGKGAGRKMIPNFIFGYDHTHLFHLYDGMMYGDGSRTKNHERYATTSTHLLGDFSRLCVHLGYGVSYSTTKHVDKNWVDIYNINIRTRCVGSMFYRHNLSKIKYDEPYIYCITVEDNHSFIAGRKGKWQYLGNCAMCAIPCITSNTCYSGTILYPELLTSPGDINKINELITKLENSTSFYRRVLSHAKKNLKYFSFDQCKRRMLSLVSKARNSK